MCSFFLSKVDKVYKICNSYNFRVLILGHNNNNDNDDYNNNNI